MRYSASLTLTLPGDAVLREPSSWARVKGLFLQPRGDSDRDTVERQLDRNVVSLTEGLCAALREIEVTDAVYLAIDGQTVYHDAAGVPSDAERLLEAAKADALRGDFSELRAVFMQRQEGLELLYEVTFQRRFLKDNPAAFIAVSGRVSALRPQAGEPLSEAQARLHTVLCDPELLPSLRTYFDERVNRLRESLGRAFPEGRAASGVTSAFLMRPAPHAVRSLAQDGLTNPQPILRPQPRCYHPVGNGPNYYDPWDCYFDDRGQLWIEYAALDEMLEGQWLPPPILQVDIVDGAGDLLCHAGEALSHLDLFSGLTELAAPRLSVSEIVVEPVGYNPWTGVLSEPAPSLDDSSLPDPADLVQAPGYYQINADSPMPGLIMDQIADVVTEVVSSLFENLGDSDSFDND